MTSLPPEEDRTSSGASPAPLRPDQPTNADPAGDGDTVATGSTGTSPEESGGAPARERAEQAASSAGDQVQHVAGVTKDEAADLANQVGQHARSLLDDATGQVEDQSRTQLSRLSDTLRQAGDDLDDMASSSDRDSVAASLTREAASRARSVGDYLADREPRQLLDDFRAYARRRPGTFLLGAAAAGLLAGRLTRGAQTASSSGSSGAPDRSGPPNPGSPDQQHRVTPADTDPGPGQRIEDAAHAASSSGPDDGPDAAAQGQHLGEPGR